MKENEANGSKSLFTRSFYLLDLCELGQFRGEMKLQSGRDGQALHLDDESVKEETCRRC